MHDGVCVQCWYSTLGGSGLHDGVSVYSVGTVHWEGADCMTVFVYSIGTVNWEGADCMTVCVCTVLVQYIGRERTA